MLILDHLLAFLVAFSTLILKLSFSQSLSIHSHLSLPQADLLGIMTTRCLAVTGGSSIGKCSPAGFHFSVHYNNIVMLTYLLTYTVHVYVSR